MHKSKLVVKWNEDKRPMQPGTYFTAQRYITGFGVYDAAVWNGDKWEIDEAIHIVGWVTFEDIVKEVDINWPAIDNKRNEAFAQRHEATQDDFKPDGFVELD